MSEMAGEANGGATSGPDKAAGGTPTESDLPELQGLGEHADDPDDPEASEPVQPPLDAGEIGGDVGGGSDPMPDMSGTSGS